MFGSPVRVTEAVGRCLTLGQGVNPGKSATSAPSVADSGLPVASATWAMKMLFVLMTPSQAHQPAAEDLRSKTWGSGEPGSLG
jgi:hypothetical protein